MSSEKKQHEAGQKLGQTDVSETERALGDFVYLPSHGDGLHFERDDDEKARECIGDKVGIVEGDSPGEAGVFRREHSLITLPQNRNLKGRRREPLPRNQRRLMSEAM